LREEGDAYGATSAEAVEYISTHALREEGDQLFNYSIQSARFISTHALREEGDQGASGTVDLVQNFYPRPPRGGRQSKLLGASRRALHFYPRPPRGGRPQHIGRQSQNAGHFYPRPPRGGRPTAKRRMEMQSTISTHALREEGDGPWPKSIRQLVDFYPRPPRGGRRHRCLSQEPPGRFLPTPSARRATYAGLQHAGSLQISTHALREEGDRFGGVCRPQRPYFYPRPPRGGRLRARPGPWIWCRISTHALREEGDLT